MGVMEDTGRLNVWRGHLALGLLRGEAQMVTAGGYTHERQGCGGSCHRQ